MDEVAVSPARPSGLKSEKSNDGVSSTHNPKARQRTRRKHEEPEDDPTKRRCVSTACIACRYAFFPCKLWLTTD